MKLIVLNEQLLGQDPAALSLGLLGATGKRDNAVTFPTLPGKTTWVGVYGLNMEDGRNIQEPKQHPSPLLVINTPSTS